MFCKCNSDRTIKQKRSVSEATQCGQATHKFLNGSATTWNPNSPAARRRRREYWDSVKMCFGLHVPYSKDIKYLFIYFVWGVVGEVFHQYPFFILFF